MSALVLRHCSSLENLEGLRGCVRLGHLTLNGCASLRDIAVLMNCPRLHRHGLDLRDCAQLPTALRQRFHTHAQLRVAHEALAL